MQKVVKPLKNYSGMTLVEILVALVILGMLLIAVFPLVTQSLQVVNQSSTIASQLFGVQEDIEIIAVTKDGAYLIDGTFVPKDFFPVLLDGDTTWVPGMTIKKSKLIRFLASNLGSEYDLFERYEGYTAEEAIITIGDKSITNTSTVKVTDKNNSDVTGNLDGFPVVSAEKVTIILPTDSNRFTNPDSLYTITITTDGTVLTSLLMVHLPRAIIADKNGDLLMASSPNPDNWVSGGSSNWVKKETNFAYRINKIISAGASDRSARFIAVGDSGSIYLWENGKKWERLTLTGITANLNNIMAVGAGGWLVVGDGGLILHSADGKSWVTRNSGTTSNLRAITYNKKSSRYFCVGDDGIMLTSSNTETWTRLHSNPLMVAATDYINNKKAVAFSGEGEYLKTRKNPVTNTDNKFTVFMVVKPTGDPVNTSLLTLGPPASYFTLRTNEDKKLVVGTSPDNVFVGTPELGTTEAAIIACRYYDDSGIPRASLYKNGSTTATDNLDIGSITPGDTADAPAQLGSNPLTHYTEPLPFEGSIAEVFIFDRALSINTEPRPWPLSGQYASEMDIVNKYLSLKYGINLANEAEINALYYNGAYSSPRLGTMDWTTWQDGMLKRYWPFTTNPTNYPGLHLDPAGGVPLPLWLDANSLTFADANQVTVWRDRSGPGSNGSNSNPAVGAPLNAVACDDDGLLYTGGDRRNLIYFDNPNNIKQDKEKLNATMAKPVQYTTEDMLFTGNRFVALLNDKHETRSYIVNLKEPGKHTREKAFSGSNCFLNDIFHYPYGKTLLVVGSGGKIYYAKDNSADWESGNSGTTTDLLAGCLR